MSIEHRSWGQSRAYTDLSFELGSTLPLQWLCKMAFLEPTYFELEVWIDDRVPEEPEKRRNKKSVERRSMEQSIAYSELLFKLGSTLSLQ